MSTSSPAASSRTSFLGSWSTSTRPSSQEAGPSRLARDPAASPTSSLPPSTASPSQTTAEKKKLQGWKHSAAGSLGGMTGAILTSPFDVMKTRLQSDLFRHTSSPPRGAGSGAGLAKALPKRAGIGGTLWQFVDTVILMRRIAVEEGWIALYKGLGPSLVGIIPARAINFYCYPTSKAFLARQFPNAPTEKLGQTSEDSPIIHLMAAVIAGIATSTGTNPLWVVKTRLQLEIKHHQNPLTQPPTPPSSSPLPRPIALSAAALAQTTQRSPASYLSQPKPSSFLPAFHMTRDIIRNEGIRGLYKGLSASYLGVTEGVIQWTLYERFKRIGNARAISLDEQKSMLSYVGSIIGASGGAKTIAAVITYPHEVLRTRLRQPAVNGVARYTGLLQTLRLIIREEGALALYGGLTAHIYRTVPNSMVMFAIYELVAAKLA